MAYNIILTDLMEVEPSLPEIPERPVQSCLIFKENIRNLYYLLIRASQLKQ